MNTLYQRMFIKFENIIIIIKLNKSKGIRYSFILFYSNLFICVDLIIIFL